MKLSEKQKNSLGKLFHDIAKIFIALLVVGPFVSKEMFNLQIFIIGLVLSVFSVIIGTILLK